MTNRIELTFLDTKTGLTFKTEAWDDARQPADLDKFFAAKGYTKLDDGAWLDRSCEHLLISREVRVSR